MQYSLPQFSASPFPSLPFSHHISTEFAFIVAVLPLLFCSSETEACRHCFSRALPPVGVQAASLLFWYIVWSSTGLSCDRYNQSCQLQLSQADRLLLWFSLLALASGKEWPIWNQHHFSLPWQKKNGQLPQQSASVLLDLPASSWLGQIQHVRETEIQLWPSKTFSLHSAWLQEELLIACRGQSLMLQRNVSLHSCRVFQSFPFQKITRLEIGRWTDELNIVYSISGPFNI